MRVSRIDKGSTNRESDITSRGLGEARTQRLLATLSLGIPNIGNAVDFADLVDFADVLMCDARLGPRLLQQSLRQVGIVSADELQGNDSIEPTIDRFVDRTHAPFSQQAKDAIALPIGRNRS